MSAEGVPSVHLVLRIWPKWDGGGKEPEWWGLHPHYGPCDGFGEYGHCAECESCWGHAFAVQHHIRGLRELAGLSVSGEQEGESK